MSDSATGQIPPLPDDFLVQNTDAIDAEAVMAELRRRIAEKQQAGLYRGVPRLALDTPPPAGAARRLEERLALLRSYARQSLEGEPIGSHRRFAGRLLVPWKRFTRFWVRRYTDALFLRQQMFNEEVSSILEDLAEDVRTMREKGEGDES